jgi:hypothetical protein
MPDFFLAAVKVEFVAEQVALGRYILGFLRFCFVSMSPPMFETYSSIIQGIKKTGPFVVAVPQGQSHHIARN